MADREHGRERTWRLRLSCRYHGHRTRSTATTEGLEGSGAGGASNQCHSLERECAAHGRTQQSNPHPVTWRHTTQKSPPSDLHVRGRRAGSSWGFRMKRLAQAHRSPERLPSADLHQTDATLARREVDSGWIRVWNPDLDPGTLDGVGAHHFTFLLSPSIPTLWAGLVLDVRTLWRALVAGRRSILRFDWKNLFDRDAELPTAIDVFLILAPKPGIAVTSCG